MAVQQQFPYYTDPRRGGYRCTRCDGVIGDGCHVLGRWDEGGTLVGVAAQDAETGRLDHSCGEPVHAPHVKTPAARLEAALLGVGAHRGEIGWEVG